MHEYSSQTQESVGVNLNEVKNRDLKHFAMFMVTVCLRQFVPTWCSKMYEGPARREGPEKINLQKYPTLGTT